MCGARGPSTSIGAAPWAGMWGEEAGSPRARFTQVRPRGSSWAGAGGGRQGSGAWVLRQLHPQGEQVFQGRATQSKRPDLVIPFCLDQAGGKS